MIFIIFGFFVSYFLTLIFLKYFIDYQKRKKIGQTIRKEGPDLHSHKEGTPTGGGLIFIPVSLSVALIISLTFHYYENLIPISAGILFSIIGLFDDLKKIREKDSKGMSASAKLLLQFSFAILIVVIIQFYYPHTYLVIPFTLNKWDIGFFYYIISAVVIVGMSNAFNLSDGSDGLSGSLFIVSLLPLVILNMNTILLLSIFGSLLAFLLYNWNPAKIFMGDVGSLSLGAIIGVIFATKGMEIFILFFGLIFLIEMFSVILQVSFFKLTGKRIFKMSPIHHHFHMLNWKEGKIVILFSTVAVFGSLLGLIAWKV